MGFRIGEFEENNSGKTESVTNLERQFNLQLYFSGAIQKLTGEEIVESRRDQKFEPYKLEADVTPIDNAILLHNVLNLIPPDTNPKALTSLVTLRLVNSYETAVVGVFFIPKLSTSDPVPANISNDQSIQAKRKKGKVAIGIPQNNIKWIHRK